METLTDELCENDQDWERSGKVKRDVMVFIGPYSEILKGRTRKSRQSTLYAFFKKGKISTSGLIREVKSLHYFIAPPPPKKDQCRNLTVPLNKTSGLGF
jgi:hypothetical protein